MLPTAFPVPERDRDIIKSEMICWALNMQKYATCIGFILVYIVTYNMQLGKL